MRIGSLFSGYGGADLAVQAVWPDATPAWFVEYDKAPSAVLAHHWPDVPNYGDVTTMDWSSVERVDILTGGYPCQPFSHAGQRRGTDDERHLFPYVATAIGVLRPRLVLLENVAGHLTLGGPEVIGTLTGLGFSVRWGVVRASDAGAPHRRARLFIVATADADDGRRGQRLRAQQPDDAVIGDGGRAVADAHDDGPREQQRQQPSMGARSDADGRSPQFGTDASADASGQRYGRGQDGGALGRVDGQDAGQSQQRQRPREVPGDRSAAAPADTQHDGRDAAAVSGSTGAQQDQGRVQQSEGHAAGFGPYAAAITRWEHVIGRPAPAPTEPGRDGRPRLNPVFVEHMMGLPEGHVTAVPGVSRVAQLKMLGNGIVWQQMALALRLLMDMDAQPVGSGLTLPTPQASDAFGAKPLADRSGDATAYGPGLRDIGYLIPGSDA